MSCLMSVLCNMFLNPVFTACRVGVACSLLWSWNTLTTSWKDLRHPCPSSCLHSFHISCCRTLIWLGKHTRPHSSCRKVARYILTELLTVLSARFSLGQPWSSSLHFSTATSPNPNPPAALSSKSNQEMHFWLRLIICYCLSTVTQNTRCGIHTTARMWKWKWTEMDAGNWAGNWEVYWV